MRKSNSEEDLRGRNPLERTKDSDGRPMMVLEGFQMGCDECKRPIAKDSVVFCCLDCSDLIMDNTYDVCGSCIGSHAEKFTEGKHRLVPGQQSGQMHVCVYDSLAKTVANRYECYCHKKFLGTFDKVKKGGCFCFFIQTSRQG